jgi:2',3'-cyclic-nucleotide 2'-phosphodiesterase (5'-nucleotidase family)
MQFVSFGYRQGNKFWFNTGKFYGLADTTGKILTKIKYEYISYFSDNGLALAKSDGKYGFIDKNGKEIIDFQFQDAHGFKYDLAAVKLNDKWGFVNTNGDLVINCEFDNVKYEFKPLMSKYQTMYNFSDE